MTPKQQEVERQRAKKECRCMCGWRQPAVVRKLSDTLDHHLDMAFANWLADAVAADKRGESDYQIQWEFDQHFGGPFYKEPLRQVA